MNELKETKKYGFWALAIMLALAYFWGVTSIQHYLPDEGLYLSLYVMAITSVGCIFFFNQHHVFKLSVTTLLWFAFFILLLIQPLLNPITYIDDNILVAMVFLFCTVLSYAMNALSVEEKQKIVNIMAWSVLAAGAFTVFSQLAQLLRWDFLVGILVFQPNNERLIGNIAQVNQAVFVGTLGIAAVYYLLYQYKPKNKIIWCLAFAVMFWFGLGVGFSASRAGIILAIASVLSAGVFYHATIKERMIKISLFAPVITLGYFIGTYWMNMLHRADISAVGRMVGEATVYRRESLLHQAWLGFMDRPLTGQGWYGLTEFGLQNAEKLVWFTRGGNAHNFIAQIGADLGILGLVILAGFAIILLKNLRFNLSPHLAFSYSILMLLGMYSLSEYPLWYLRFLILAVFFVAIIDISKLSFNANLNFRPMAFGLSLVFLFGSIYYITQYLPYARMAYTIQSDETHEEKVAQFQKLPNVYGYTMYKELMLYILMPISEDTMHQHIELGNRVLSRFLSTPLLNKQANLLAVAGYEAEADVMYRKACVFDYLKENPVNTLCNPVIENIEDSARNNPEYFGPYRDRFMLWYNKTQGTRLVE